MATNVDVAYLADEAALMRDEETMLGLIWRQFRKHKMALAGLAFVLFLTLTTIFGPSLSPYDVERSSLRERYQPPSVEHIFGTDDLGRDMLVRLMQGGRVSLSVGVLSMGLSITIGLIVGSIAGFYGGRIDNILMRATDIMLTLPSLFLLILMVVMLTIFGGLIVKAVTGQMF